MATNYAQHNFHFILLAKTLTELAQIQGVEKETECLEEKVTKSHVRKELRMGDMVMWLWPSLN